MKISELLVKQNRKHLILLIVSLLVYMLIIISVTKIYSIDSISILEKRIIQNAVYIFMLVGTIILIKITKKPFSEFGFFKGRFCRQILIGFVIGLANMLLMMIFAKLPKFPENIIYTILSQILVGFSEESFCRGFFLTIINNITKSKDLSVFLSSLFFALCHLPIYGNILQIIPIFAIGIFMAVLRTEFKDSVSILSLAIGHAIFNIF